MKILVSSDFHGNFNHAKTIKQAVDLHKPDIFIHAGDYCPTRLVYQNPQDTIDFLENNFFSYLKDLNVPFKFALSGNTDLLPVTEYFQQKYNDPKVVKMVQDDYFDFPTFRLLLLSVIPRTTHCLKDFEVDEKFDPDLDELQGAYVFSRSVNSTPYEQSKPKNTTDKVDYDQRFFEVFHSREVIPDLYAKRMKHTIFDRLTSISQDCTKPMILVSHAPCYNTAADMRIRKGQVIHPGSRDVREFCLNNDVKAVISGHNHESVLVSKTHVSEIQEKSGKFSYSTGNSGVDVGLCERCNYIVLDSDAPEKGEFYQVVAQPGYPHIRNDRNFANQQ